MLQVNRFAPAKLKVVVQEIVRQARSLPPADLIPIDSGKLEKLRIEYKAILNSPVSKLDSWYTSLKRKYKMLLPYLYEQTLSESYKSSVLNAFKKNIPYDNRMFKSLLFAMYRTADTGNLLPLVKHAFKEHHGRITRRMDEQTKADWKQFIDTTPREFISHIVRTNSDSFANIAKRIYLNDGFVYFFTLAITYFKEGKQEAFKKDSLLFTELYKRNLNQKIRAELVEIFINSVELKEYPDLVEKIYTDMKTHMTKPQLWEGINQTAKDKFHMFVIKKRLLEFFGSLNQNHERFVYWKKFFHKLYDVALPDSNQTMLMYFEREVILEILGTGAIYVYDKNDFMNLLQPIVNEALKYKSRNSKDYEIPGLKRRKLMDRDIVKQTRNFEGWFSHYNGWEMRVDAFLKECGWEVNKRVLEEEARRQKFELD
jgi:hypothetical protein